MVGRSCGRGSVMEVDWSPDGSLPGGRELGRWRCGCEAGMCYLIAVGPALGGGRIVGEWRPRLQAP